MLNALVGADLVNVTAVVARFFGGVKLGAGGLIRAYGGCVADAIKGLPRVSLQSRTIWTLDLPHGEVGRVQEELLRGGGTLMDMIYQDAGVHLVFTFPTDPKGIIARATHGGCIPLPERVEMVDVPI
jgi:putative IMPACT (imprinted ancient) family translation regulator